MKESDQLESLRIIDIIEDKYSQELYVQGCFEIIYIHYGTGVHVLNNISTSYEKGDLFLLAPGDHHFFTPEVVTRFTYIKFTPDYFEFHNHSTKNLSHKVTPTSIIQMQYLQQEKIAVRGTCQNILKNIFENIILYNTTIDVIYSPIVYYHILSIFGMVKECLTIRNIELKKLTPTKSLITEYIQKNIYNRDYISIKSISRHFNISESYFSKYFKRNFGIGYRDFLEKLQLQLIKRRLQTGEIKLKEIADEFGFTDASHLSKFFKRHEGVNPSEYKNTFFANADAL